MPLVCPNCGHEIIWQSDFDFDDLGYEGDGIVSFYSCPHCGADIEVRIPISTEK